MKLSSLSQVCDSDVKSRKDQLKEDMRKRISDSQESITEVVESLSEGENPADIVAAAAEIMQEAAAEMKAREGEGVEIEGEVEEIQDAKRRLRDARRRMMKRKRAVKVGDALKRKIRSRLMDTESTEEAIDVAREALEDNEPEEVVSAVIEVLGDIIDNMQE